VTPLENANELTVDTATRFEIHIADEDGAGGIGYQTTEAHCRSVASYLTGRMRDVMAICSFHTGVGGTWQNFATYMKGWEATDEQQADWIKQRVSFNDARGYEG
jgi:hypothetical protein